MSEMTLKVLLFFGISSFMGWILLFVGMGARRDRRRREETERASATGVIVDIVRREYPSGRSGTTVYWKPVVEFTAEGGPVRKEYDMRIDPEAHAVGETVELLYDVSNPEHFHLEMDEAYHNGGATAMRVAIIWILLSIALTLALAVFVGGADIGEFSIIGRGLRGTPFFRGNAPKVEEKRADAFQYRLTDAGAEITSYTGNAAELTLPVLLDGNLVTGIANAAFNGNWSVVSLTVPGTYMRIPMAGFAGLIALEELTLRDGVTSIGKYAFNTCKSLREVHLPASLSRIADDAFPQDCRATFHVVEGSYAEAWCKEKGFRTER